MLEQFTEYCNVHALLPDYQLAYRVNYSCDTSVTHVFNNILWAMEWQEICSMCLCDLSTAFDTVNHQVLLQVLLTRFGVDHTALKWFDSYLCPRYCKVNIGCSYSSDRPLDCCVPQGSLAGPNLFSVYSSNTTGTNTSIGTTFYWSWLCFSGSIPHGLVHLSHKIW